jgi:hypothetical protein
VAGDSTSIADRMSIGAGPFAYCRRVLGTATATASFHRRRLIGGFRGRTGSTGSTTPSQTPTCSRELIEVRLAQVEFVAGGAVVHSNRRHGLGAVTVQIAGKHDTCCLSHDTSVQRYTSDRLLAQIRRRNDRSSSPHSGSSASDRALQDYPRNCPHGEGCGRERKGGAHARIHRAAAPRGALPCRRSRPTRSV